MNIFLTALCLEWTRIIKQEISKIKKKAVGELWVNNVPKPTRSVKRETDKKKQFWVDHG